MRHVVSQTKKEGARSTKEGAQQAVFGRGREKEMEEKRKMHKGIAKDKENANLRLKSTRGKGFKKADKEPWKIKGDRGF